MLFCIVTFNLWLHYNKLLTYLYLPSVSKVIQTPVLSYLSSVYLPSVSEIRRLCEPYISSMLFARFYVFPYFLAFLQLFLRHHGNSWQGVMYDCYAVCDRVYQHHGKTVA